MRHFFMGIVPTSQMKHWLFLLPNLPRIFLSTLSALCLQPNDQLIFQILEFKFCSSYVCRCISAATRAWWAVEEQGQPMDPSNSTCSRRLCFCPEVDENESSPQKSVLLMCKNLKKCLSGMCQMFRAPCTKQSLKAGNIS